MKETIAIIATVYSNDSELLSNAGTNKWCKSIAQIFSHSQKYEFCSCQSNMNYERHGGFIKLIYNNIIYLNKR